MPDPPGHVVQGESSRAIAYALLLGLAAHESKITYQGGVPVVKADKEWIIENFNAIHDGIK